MALHQPNSFEEALQRVLLHGADEHFFCQSQGGNFDTNNSTTRIAKATLQALVGEMSELMNKIGQCSTTTKPLTKRLYLFMQGNQQLNPCPQTVYGYCGSETRQKVRREGLKTLEPSPRVFKLAALGPPPGTRQV